MNSDDDIFRKDMTTLLGVFNKHQVQILDGAELIQACTVSRKNQKIIFSIKNLTFYLREKSSLCFNSNGIMVLQANAKIIIDNSGNDSRDKIKEYTLEIQADAMSENKPQYYCWHFDRHTNANNENLVHPYYHLQFGGDFLKDKEFGNILHFKAPRVAHPPLDAFLCIHFVITNFCSQRHYPWVNKILADSEYVDIIMRAQERFWKPYFDGLASDSIHIDFNIGKLFPMSLRGVHA